MGCISSILCVFPSPNFWLHLSYKKEKKKVLIYGDTGKEPLSLLTPVLYYKLQHFLTRRKWSIGTCHCTVSSADFIFCKEKKGYGTLWYLSKSEVDGNAVTKKKEKAKGDWTQFQWIPQGKIALILRDPESILIMIPKQCVYYFHMGESHNNSCRESFYFGFRWVRTVIRF